jgi:hypothetical protein
VRREEQRNRLELFRDSARDHDLFLSTGNLTTICFLHSRKKLGRRCAENLTEAQNGHDQQWHGRVWLNPPFDRYKVGSLDCPACLP